jgi:hypothetical protein
MTHLQPQSYRAAARAMRRIADRLDFYAEARTPLQRMSLTRAVNEALRFSKRLYQRHRESWRARP